MSSSNSGKGNILGRNKKTIQGFDELPASCCVKEKTIVRHVKYTVIASTCSLSEYRGTTSKKSTKQDLCKSRVMSYVEPNYCFINKSREIGKCTQTYSFSVIHHSRLRIETSLHDPHYLSLPILHINAATPFQTVRPPS